MELHTSAEVISFAKKLENESARFYEDLSRRYAQDKEVMLCFVKENQKYAAQIERAYYSVISDALEGCFAFRIEADEYMFEITLPRNTVYSDALNKAIEIEERMTKFYSDAAEQSKSLMADVPRVFAIVSKKRGERRLKLRALLGKED